MHTKRKYIFHFYIYLLLALSSRTFRIISCLSYEYILSVSYNCFLVNMTYIRSILYIHFNISHHTLQTYHVRSIIYDMICFVFFFFECIDICNIYIYILHVHICLMKMRSMHISLGIDHCIDYLQ